MAGSINSVTLLGNVGKDPEIRTLNSGDKVANFSIATSESWTDKASGEKKEVTEWHNITCFNDGLVGVIERYVTKGSKVAIHGAAIKTRSYEKDGITRYATEIVISKFRGELTLCGGGEERGADRGESRSARGGGGDGGSYRDASRGSGGTTTQARGGFDTSDLDDEIPFVSSVSVW